MTTLQDFTASAMLHSHSEDSSLYEGTLWTNPDTLLHSTDEYMASLIQQVSDEPDSLCREDLADLQTIFVVCGYG